MHDPVYLDNNATTRIYEEALEEIIRVSRGVYANPSSNHKQGDAARAVVENSREILAGLLSVRPDEIIFTSCGSEGDNLAIKGLADLQTKKDHIISTTIEHSAVYNTIKYLETKGFRVTWLTPDRTGRIRVSDFEKAVTDKTFLLSVIWANNEIGTVQDIPALGAAARKNGVIFHSDGVQAFGKIPVHLYKSNVDLFTASAHKIHGPKGVGFLFKRRDIELTPLIHGGDQEGGFRSGTENVPLIAAMVKAASIKYADGRMEKESKYLRILTTKFYDRVKTLIPFAERNGHPDERITNTVNIRFPGVDGPKLITALSDEGIFATPSSACSSHSSKPSRILTSLGLMADEAFSSVRFSFDAENTEEEAEYTALKLKEIVDRLM